MQSNVAQVLYMDFNTLHIHVRLKKARQQFLGHRQICPSSYISLNALHIMFTENVPPVIEIECPFSLVPPPPPPPLKKCMPQRSNLSAPLVLCPLLAEKCPQ